MSPSLWLIQLWQPNSSIRGRNAHSPPSAVIAGRCLPDRGDQSDDNLQALSRDGYLTEVFSCRMIECTLLDRWPYQLGNSALAHSGNGF